MSVNVQTKNGLKQIADKTTKNKILNVLGYTPASQEDLINHRGDVDIHISSLEKDKWDNKPETYEELKEKPSISEDETDILYVVDENNNIIAYVDSRGIHTIALEVITQDGKKDIVEFIKESILNLRNDIQESISLDYNDLDNKPIENEENNDALYVTDDSGNIIARFDSNGLNVTNVVINGKKAATLDDILNSGGGSGGEYPSNPIFESVDVTSSLSAENISTNEIDINGVTFIDSLGISTNNITSGYITASGGVTTSLVNATGVDVGDYTSIDGEHVSTKRVSADEISVGGGANKIDKDGFYANEITIKDSDGSDKVLINENGIGTSKSVNAGSVNVGTTKVLNNQIETPTIITDKILSMDDTYLLRKEENKVVVGEYDNSRNVELRGLDRPTWNNEDGVKELAILDDLNNITIENIENLTINKKLNVNSIHSLSDLNIITRIKSNTDDNGLINIGNIIDNVQISSASQPSWYNTSGKIRTLATLDDLASVSSLDIQVVSELPTENISTTTIYLKSTNGSEQNIYEEYIYVNNAWELIGTTKVDLSEYAKKTETSALTTSVNNLGNRIVLLENSSLTQAEKEEILELNRNVSILEDEVNTQISVINNLQSNKADKSELFSKNYNDLTNKPTIPTKVSELDNDSGYLTSATGNTLYLKLSSVKNSKDAEKHLADSDVLNVGGLNTYLSDMQYATKQDITNLVNSAPETLDTLGELATAFNENKEVVEALDNAISNKADKTELPTKTSQLTNDSGFITLDDIPTSGGEFPKEPEFDNVTINENGNIIFKNHDQGIIFEQCDAEPVIYLDSGDDSVVIGASTKIQGSLNVGTGVIIRNPEEPYEETHLQDFGLSSAYSGSPEDGSTNLSIGYFELNTDFANSFIHLVPEEWRASFQFGDKLIELNNSGITHSSDGENFYTLTLPNKSGTLATLDDISSGGGGSTELPKEPEFKSVTVTNTTDEPFVKVVSNDDDTIYTRLSPSYIDSYYGDTNVYMSAEEVGLFMYGPRLSSEYRGNYISLSFDDQNEPSAFLATGSLELEDPISQSHIYLYAEEARTEFKFQDDYIQLDSDGIHLTHFEDQGTFVDINRECIYLERYGSYIDISPEANAITIHDDNTGNNISIGPDHINHNKNDVNYTLSFPEKSGTLATTDDVSEDKINKLIAAYMSANYENGNTGAY